MRWPIEPFQNDQNVAYALAAAVRPFHRPAERLGTRRPRAMLDHCDYEGFYAPQRRNGALKERLQVSFRVSFVPFHILGVPMERSRPHVALAAFSGHCSVGLKTGRRLYEHRDDWGRQRVRLFSGTGRAVVSIEADTSRATRWRARLPDQHFMDLLNLSRAKNATAPPALAALNRREAA